MDGAQEIAGCLVIARGDGPVLLEFGEEAVSQEAPGMFSRTGLTEVVDHGFDALERPRRIGTRGRLGASCPRRA